MALRLWNIDCALLPVKIITWDVTYIEGLCVWLCSPEGLAGDWKIHPIMGLCLSLGRGYRFLVGLSQLGNI